MLLVLKELYPDNTGWNQEVFVRIQSLLIEYQLDIKLSHIGFPQNWQEMLMLS
jgi:abortive infection bacteriophage resistance protein